MIPAAGLLGALAAGGAAAGVATLAGSAFPLYGILGMMMGNRYARYAVPENEPGYVVNARLMHSDDDPAISWFENRGESLPTWRHYQFIRDDGYNKGWGKKGEFSDPLHALPEYTLDNPFGNVHYDARIIEKGLADRQRAIEEIRRMKMEDPDLYGDPDDADLGDYEGLMNNCHDFIADVLWRGAGNSWR